MGITVPQMQQCVANLSACPAQILARIGYQTVRPIVDQYIGFLQNQAGNNVYRLDESLISQIQPYYSVDLHAVRYATGINTIHGANVTIGNTIYFVKGMELPPVGLAATLPVSCQSCSHFTAELALTSKQSAASRRDAPAITASSRRIRKSREQGFGIDGLPRINALRLPHPRKIENLRFNSAEICSSAQGLLDRRVA